MARKGSIKMPKPERMPPVRNMSTAIIVISTTALMLGNVFFFCNAQFG